MARIQLPAPGRLIISFIYSSLDALTDALTEVERRFGPVQYETLDIPCTEVSRYREEMGGDLTRRFFSFEREVECDQLIACKKICHKIESRYGDQVDDTTFRTVNMDPGLMTPENLVVASHREANHRVYLGDGVYADLTLVWSQGRFVRLPWTPEDYCHDEAIDLFQRVHTSFDVLDPERTPSF